jgi:hypothetical protein
MAAKDKERDYEGGNSYQYTVNKPPNRDNGRKICYE